MIGAVNTVRRQGDRLIGENTDEKGFLCGVREEAEVSPKGERVTILGAGGAARAITFELALAGVGELVVLNRSAERGQGLVQDLKARTGVSAQFMPWSSNYQIPSDVDILVNATAIGLHPDILAMPEVTLESARPDLLVCDVIPNPPETRLIQAARTLGFRVLTGLAMLVYQGAIGFEMWTGQKAPEAVMREALRHAFNG